MQVSSAQLPPGGGDDTIITGDSYLIMLDGASAFTPMPVPAVVYADRLGRHIASRLDTQPGRELRGCLADAISHTADDLELRPGHSPSSTVIIFRLAGDNAECLVLGDSLAVLAGRSITDDRLSRIRPDLRERYRQRLADGRGYDSEHRRILAELQTEQARRRNQPGGYWIAETDPGAADHAILVTSHAESLPSVVLATDGAYRTMSYLGLADWPALRDATTGDLARLLGRCQSWEADEDPSGQKLPRAKCHDDKSLATISLVPYAD
jgi:hypothetical protein